MSLKNRYARGKLIITIVIFSLALVVISPKTIDAGHEGVVIKKPWFYGNSGVEKETVSTGTVWTVRSTEIVSVNLRPYIINEVFDDLITKDNNPVDFKIHLTFINIQGKTPILVEKFGVDWYINKLREPLRNTVRAFTKNTKMFDMTTNSEVTRKMQENVSLLVKAFLKKEGIPVRLTNTTIGKVMPPKDVIASTIATAVQKQNVKTQKERVKAEESRKKAEIASANADKAYAQTFGFSPNQYLRIKKLENERLAIEAAKDGKINISLVLGNAQPIFNIK